MNTENRKRIIQLSILFASHLAILFSGMGLFPILPVYAGQFGAGAGQIGLYLSLTYLSITAGTLLTGWLPSRVSRKGIFIAAGLAGIPALILMGHITRFWQLVVLTGVIWFLGGIGISLVQLFTSQYVGKGSQRKPSGQVFGLQSLAAPLGALFGGAAVGRLIDTRGYAAMFTVLALVWALWPLLAGLFLQNHPQAVIAGRKAQHWSEGFRPDVQTEPHTIKFILLAGLLTAITISIGRLGLSLSMKSLHFSPADISSTTVVSGLAGILLMLAISASAGRLGARFFLLLGFLSTVAATLMVILTNQIQIFRVAAVLYLVAQNINRSMSLALVVEIYPREELGKKLSWVGTANWAANVAGFASLGPGLAVLGPHNFYAAVAVLPLIAAFLLFGTKTRQAAYPRKTVYQNVK